MRTSFVTRLAGWIFLCGGFPVACAEGDPFEMFLPGEAVIERLRLTIDQLASDSFVEREAASRSLAELPALPGFIRELARTSGDPESRQRLRELVAAFPLDREDARLSGILHDMAADAAKGHLGSIVRVMEAGVWSPEPEKLYAAARGTVVAGDLEWIAEALAGSKAVLRRIAAAALRGLSAAESDPLLGTLLGDADETVALLAAVALAERGNAGSLAALARLLESGDFHTRHRAHHALRGLTGEDFLYDPSAKPEERRIASGRWLEWAASGRAAISGPLPEYAAIHLFTGFDMASWELFEDGKLGDPVGVWEIVHLDETNRILCCKAGTKGDLWTKQRFENYVLTLDYKVDRVDQDGGVGVLLTEENETLDATPGYLEVQILPGKAGDLYQIGAIQAEANGRAIQFLHPRDREAVDRLGAWNTLEITVRNGAIKVVINGLLVNETSQGPRGPGRIVLRNEGSPVSFRDIHLDPTVPAARP